MTSLLSVDATTTLLVRTTTYVLPHTSPQTRVDPSSSSTLNGLHFHRRRRVMMEGRTRRFQSLVRIVVPPSNTPPKTLSLIH